MEIKLLKNGYKKSDQFYNDFLEDQIKKTTQKTKNVWLPSKVRNFPVAVAEHVV